MAPSCCRQIRTFSIAAGRGQHLGPNGPGHLDHARADAAGAAVDEHLLAHLQLPIAEQAEMRGDAHQRHRRGILVRDFLGRRIEPTLVDRGIFGERALTAQQSLVAAPDAVALAELRHGRPNRLDHAGQIAADHKRLRQVHRIHARPDVRIDRIDGHRLDLDQHLVVGGFRFGQVAENDVLRWSWLFDVRRFHVSIAPN